MLESPPEWNSAIRSDLGLKEADENDRVDNEILYALYRDAANLLITEDRQIHAKAKLIGIDERVLYAQQAVAALERLHEQKRIDLPSIQDVPLHALDLNDQFFDSIRANYQGFNKWFREKSREGRRGWVHYTPEGQLGALEIFKEESSPIVTSDKRGLPGRVLKLCTFKVAPVDRGQKVGELLLKAAFRYASQNNLESIYLTMYADKHDHLRDLCSDFGFYKYGVSNGEEVFVKDHPVCAPRIGDLSAFDYNRRFYPHYRDDPEIRKFIVPIRPEFHEILFPDAQLQESLFSANPAGNAIKQAYLCHAPTGEIRPGDLLWFYRSRDLQAITSIGVVESVAEMDDVDKIVQMVAKRTVYSYQDIRAMAQKKTKVILFRQVQNLDREIPFATLKSEGIVRGYIQTIRKIDQPQYEALLNEVR